MKQQTLAMAADQGAGFETHRKRTRRDEFLGTMNMIMPWAELCALIEPHYPKRGNPSLRALVCCVSAESAPPRTDDGRARNFG
jgi:hypothetical protein